MSFMLQIWMKLMVLMLLMMSNLTIMTMMMILMMIRPGEGGTFCWLAGQPAGQLAGRGTLTLSEKNSSIPITQDFRRKNRSFTSLIIFCHLAGALNPTSILIFIALFDCALQKWVYIDQMQVLWKSLKIKEKGASELSSKFRKFRWLKRRFNRSSGRLVTFPVI